MPVLTLHTITRNDVQDNPSVLFLFGDNDARDGDKGLAKEVRDEENAVGIRLKWNPGTETSSYFDDEDFESITQMIDQDLDPVVDHLNSGGIVVLPAGGLFPMALVKRRSPRIAEYVEERLQALKDDTE